jgi:hypothetical protein
MAIWVDKTVRIHEAVILRLVVGRAARGDRFGDETIYLLTALATEGEQNLDGLARIADGFGVKSRNLACVSNITETVSLTTMHAPVSSVPCGLCE